VSEIEIAGRKINLKHPTYFVADIASNHDRDLDRAKELIYLCAEAGAEAAKFQHFTAKTIVSDYGFRSLGANLSHQAKWDNSVFDVYQKASINLEWSEILSETCEKAGITFMTSPYSFELVDAVDKYVRAFKIGSGDMTWHAIIDYIAAKGKPVMIATGAATFDEVCAALDAALARTPRVILMQCNTNYTGSHENFKYVNLNVLKSFREMYPDLVLGLSDHTNGHATVLGAVALGARVIEKHFTDNPAREGPDHSFSMDPKTWSEMVERTRELESALGSGIKKVEKNEQETVILQRRSIRFRVDVSEGTTIAQEMLEVLRPCPSDGLPPFRLKEVLGRKISRNYQAGEHLRWNTLM
jgi:sialic acid synthase SpsE